MYPVAIISFLQVKLKCSLKWLSGILSESPEVQEQVTLLEPYQDGKLKNSLVLLLTNPSLYISAYEVLFPGEHVDGGSFEPLIHGLAKKGGYVLEDDTNIVTGPMLAQESPFMEVWLRFFLNKILSVCSPIPEKSFSFVGRAYDPICFQVYHSAYSC